MDPPFPLTGESILCISSIDWDFVWQGHQEIMAALAREGNRVLFVENTGVRSPHLRDLPRLSRRIRNWWRGTQGFRQERENLVVYSPILLPFPYSRLARWINRFLLHRALRRWMRASRFRRPILWTFLPTPLVLDLIRDFDPEMVVYYCVDNLAESSRAARRIIRSEETLLKEADLVFVTAKKLLERARRHNAHVTLFPFGVQFGQFDQARRDGTQLPEDLREIRKPVVGYIGGIRKEIDLNLLKAVASRLPEATFVMVGPLQTDVSELGRCPNIRFVGAREHGELPSYMNAFDVGIIPYEVNPYTDHIYPAKLNEYLAMGLPVVATDLTEVRHFNAEHGNLIKVAQDATGFARAIEEALQDNSKEESFRRVEVARGNRWEERIRQMAERVAQELIRRRVGAVPWEEALRRLYRTTRKRLVTTLGWVSVATLLLFHTPVLWWAAQPLKISQPPRKADAIILFAGGVGESGKAGEGYQERVKQAVDFYHQGWAPRVLVVSGYTRIFEEADIMRSLMIDLGVPREHILQEKRVAHTYDYVLRVKERAASQGWKTCLLVTSPYHARRADLTFSRNVPELTIVHTPVRESIYYARGRWVNPRQIRGIFHEVAALAYYWVKGWI